ncbi:head maturation protease, ClpP-related [Clostridium homopropionicum]|nr:head maturation protease, ClpP-related [Clostridium homopropionicum]
MKGSDRMPFWNFKNNEENEEEIELRIDGDIAMDDDFWSLLFGIENVTPKGFISELAQYKGKDINVWINSYGGDVYAASRIYTALKEHKGKVKVKIDGVAISAASVIAMAGDEILMSPTSILMIHNPWGNFQGEAKDLRHGADVLDEVKETIINAYQLKTKKSRAKISQMMDEETWMSAKKALAEGFVDGMLYTENKEGSVENSFMFSRFAIQNSLNTRTRDFIKQYNQRFKETYKDEEKIKLLKSKLALECEL